MLSGLAIPRVGISCGPKAGVHRPAAQHLGLCRSRQAWLEHGDPQEPPGWGRREQPGPEGGGMHQAGCSLGRVLCWG